MQFSGVVGVLTSACSRPLLRSGGSAAPCKPSSQWAMVPHNPCSGGWCLSL